MLIVIVWCVIPRGAPEKGENWKTKKERGRGEEQMKREKKKGQKEREKGLVFWNFGHRFGAGAKFGYSSAKLFIYR